MFQLDLNTAVLGSAQIEIQKPVHQVFSFVADGFFENYPKWAEEVIDFKPINNNPMSVGALARQTRVDQGQRVESTFEVKIYERNRRLVLEGLSDPYLHQFQFEGTEQSTLLTESFELLHVELFMLPFEKLIRTAIEEGLENSLNNIKTVLE